MLPICPSSKLLFSRPAVGTTPVMLQLCVTLNVFASGGTSGAWVMLKSKNHDKLKMDDRRGICSIPKSLTSWRDLRSTG